MKTNHAQNLAWFEHSVKPNVMTHQQQETRCWHATTKRPIVAFEHFDNTREEDSSSRTLSNPRKRQRVQTDSPFLTTMEEDKTTPMSPITIDDIIEFEPVSDMDITLIENQAVKSNIFRNNNIPIRTTSKISLYYDANDQWDNTMPGTPIPEEFIPPVPTKPIPTNHIPIVSRREEIESILLDKFRLRGFIPNQYEAITATMDEQDILVVLPSGSSRNVCYQLPILFQHPKLITVVLVPSLIDLLEKDDHTIETHEIPTLFVCKSKKTYKKNWISRSELTLDVLKQTQLIYMTFNDFGKYQVHCISQWGDDFYFGYLRTTEDLKETYASIPITALTAIPNERIHLDIIHQLKLKQCKIFKKSILF